MLPETQLKVRPTKKNMVAAAAGRRHIMLSLPGHAGHAGGAPASLSVVCKMDTNPEACVQYFLKYNET